MNFNQSRGPRVAPPPTYSKSRGAGGTGAQPVNRKGTISFPPSFKCPGQGALKDYSTYIQKSPRPVSVASPSPLQFQIPTGGPAYSLALALSVFQWNSLWGRLPQLSPQHTPKCIFRYYGCFMAAGLYARNNYRCWLSCKPAAMVWAAFSCCGAKD